MLGVIVNITCRQATNYEVERGVFNVCHVLNNEVLLLPRLCTDARSSQG